MIGGGSSVWVIDAVATFGDESIVDAVGINANCVEMGVVRQEIRNTATVPNNRERMKLFLFICNTPAIKATKRSPLPKCQLPTVEQV